MAEYCNKIIGKYVCKEGKLLGKGLMCTVYQAKHRDTNKYVALKQISKKSEDISEKKLKDSYLLEIEILQKCQKKDNHKNVISLIDFFETSHHYNIVLELCQYNLKEYLERQENKRLNQEEAVNILIQIVEGEICLHELRYCHRDIKPENILFKDGCVKITDVNLAKHLEDLIQGQTQSRVGTPLYIAPEVRSKKQYSPYKADVYSLGIVLYEMIYGLLKSSEMLIDLKEKIESSKLKVDKILKELIIKMVNQDPQSRADWSYVSSVLFQYIINKQQMTNSIQIITSYYYNTWKEELSFLKQIIEDCTQLQIQDEYILLYPSAFLIIKLIYSLLEEKICQLQIQDRKEEARNLNNDKKIISLHLKTYLNDTKKWLSNMLASQKVVPCMSDELIEELSLVEKSKNFYKYFQHYLIGFFDQLNQYNGPEKWELKKKYLQLKLLIACDKTNDFQLVQDLLNKSKPFSEQHILETCKELEDFEKIEKYRKCLLPIKELFIKNQ